MTRQTLHFDCAQREHSRNFNLFQLRLALIAAEKDAPARPPKASRNADELLAQALIERIKQTPRQPLSFLGLQIESPQPLIHESILEMDVVHA